MLPDAPDIARTLATGYPEKSEPPRCWECEEVLTGDVYKVSDWYYCPECYRDYLKTRIEYDDIWELAERFDHDIVDVSDITF